MVGGVTSPYTFNIINYEKANSQFNFGQFFLQQVFLPQINVHSTTNKRSIKKRVLQ